jgi:hypothetical protein
MIAWIPMLYGKRKTETLSRAKNNDFGPLGRRIPTGQAEPLCHAFSDIHNQHID